MNDKDWNNTENHPSRRPAAAGNAARPRKAQPHSPPAGHDPPPAERDLREIMAGAREIVLVHNGERYRLRITANGKLILTK